MQTSGRATRRTIPNVSRPMLRIAHLYADEMNIYGDRGNILTLQKRAEWRGIPVEVRAIGRGLQPPTLVGFENDSGKTYLGAGLRPLGQVIRGAGNNGEDGTEGVAAGNVFGTYLHGSLLPKNPHFADFLLLRALQRRGPVRFEALDDTMEMAAHNAVRERIGARR